VLVHHARNDADGKTLEIEYGDLAKTKTSFLYDERRRVKTVQTYRGSLVLDCGARAGPLGMPGLPPLGSVQQRNAVDLPAAGGHGVQLRRGG